MSADTLGAHSLQAESCLASRWHNSSGQRLNRQLGWPLWEERQLSAPDEEDKTEGGKRNKAATWEGGLGAFL